MASRKGWWYLSRPIAYMCYRFTIYLVLLTDSSEFTGCSWFLSFDLYIFLACALCLFLLTDAWFELQVNEMLEEKVRPYIQNIENEVLSETILLKPKKQETVFSLSLPPSACVYFIRVLCMLTSIETETFLFGMSCWDSLRMYVARLIYSRPLMN
jgi:hypothetical protein